jgi:hypothetical protein
MAHAVNKPDVIRAAQRPESGGSLPKSQYCNIRLDHQQPVVQIHGFSATQRGPGGDSMTISPITHSGFESGGF